MLACRDSVLAPSRRDVRSEIRARASFPPATERAPSSRAGARSPRRTGCCAPSSAWATTTAVTPAVILRNVLENPGWYTQYTPYQAEIAQGRLEALLNFQTMVTDLTGLPARQRVAPRRGHRRRRGDDDVPRDRRDRNATVFFVAEDCHPQTIAVVQTRAPSRWASRSWSAPLRSRRPRQPELFGVLVQYPATDGSDPRLRRVSPSAPTPQGALVAWRRICWRLTLLRPPGRVRRGHRHRHRAALRRARWATADRTPPSSPRARSQAGRCPAASSASRRTPRASPRYRLALQTREQHIRRDKATSNICTAQVLLAIMAEHVRRLPRPGGPPRASRRRVHALARAARSGPASAGLRSRRQARSSTRSGSDQIRRRARRSSKARGSRESISATPGRSHRDRPRRDHLADRGDPRLLVFAAGHAAPRSRSSAETVDRAFRAPHARNRAFLTHPVFHRYHSEHEMLRYLAPPAGARPLARPLDDPARLVHDEAQRHGGDVPGDLARVRQAPSVRAGRPDAGLRRAVRASSSDGSPRSPASPPCRCNPTPGSQGEYAGLLAIRAYHEAAATSTRDVCLIPVSRPRHQPGERGDGRLSSRGRRLR